METDDADRAFIDSMIPDGAIVTGFVGMVTFIEPESGCHAWRVHCDVDLPVSQTLGFLELAKLDIIARSNTGLPISYDIDDE